MEFESVADAQRYLSNQVAVCAYTATMLLNGAPASTIEPLGLIGNLRRVVEEITTTLETLARTAPRSQKVELGLARAPALLEALRRPGAEAALTELEAAFSTFFAAFEMLPPFPELLQTVRANRADARTRARRRWLVIVIGVLVVEVVALAVFDWTARRELTSRYTANRRIQTQIDDIEKLIANHAEIQNSIAVLRTREEALSSLQPTRLDPTAALTELEPLFSAGADNRLQLTSYVEEEEGRVRIEGLARAAVDVSAVVNRLRLSDHFYDVRIAPRSETEDTKSGSQLVAFALDLRVRYR